MSELHNSNDKGRGNLKCPPLISDLNLNWTENMPLFSNVPIYCRRFFWDGRQKTRSNLRISLLLCEYLVFLKKMERNPFIRILLSSIEFIMPQVFLTSSWFIFWFPQETLLLYGAHFGCKNNSSTPLERNWIRYVDTLGKKWSGTHLRINTFQPASV